MCGDDDECDDLAELEVISKKKKAIRNFWSYEEKETMLSIFQEKNIVALFDGKKYKNRDIYISIYEDMVSRGIKSKSPVQIQTKWKAMKSTYMTVQKLHKTSGEARKECEFYDMINEILGGRPAVVMETMDTYDPSTRDVEIDEEIRSEDLVELLSPGESASPGTDNGNSSNSINNQLESADSCASPGVCKSNENTAQNKSESHNSRTGASPANKNSNGGDTPKKVIRKKSSVSKQNKWSEFFNFQRELMKTFIDEQRKSDEIESNKRKEEMKDFFKFINTSNQNYFNQQRSSLMIQQQPLFSPNFSQTPNLFLPGASSTPINTWISPTNTNDEHEGNKILEHPNE